MLRSGILAAIVLAGCANAGPFTDADLQSALAEASGPLVVYVWSPHMPLSVDGYPEIAAAGEALDLTVVPVLFAGSDREFAAREASRVGIPEAGLRELVSSELLGREAQVHAPSIVVFDGERVSPVLPGYRNAAGYRRYLEGVLGGAQP